MGQVWTSSNSTSSSLGIHINLHRPAEFRPNQTIRDTVMTPYPFSKWRPRYRNSISGFSFVDFAHLGRSKSTCIPNIGEISQSTVEILLLPVSENKRLPCWNSTPGSDFYICITIGMSFCICLPNFVQIRPSTTELWRHIHFQDGGRQVYWIISRLLQTTDEVQMGSQVGPQMLSRSDLYFQR